MAYTITSMEMFLDNNLSDRAKVLYTVMQGLADEGHSIRISEKELAEKFSVTDRTVRDTLSKLEDYGLIAKYKEGFKQVIVYAIIPYEMRKKVILESKEEMYILLDEIREYVDKKIGRIQEDKKPAEEEEKPAEEVKNTNTPYYFAEYFREKAEKHYGVVSNIGAKQLQMMRRVSKGRTSGEMLELIDIFFMVYEDKYKKIGFEYPTISSFCATWIFNNLVVIYNQMERARMSRDEEMADEVF